MDSRWVRPGDLYVAVPGQHTHGAGFARQAVAAGAVAVLTDALGARTIGDLAVPVLEVPDPRRQLAGLAAEIYGRPADQVTTLAITGTNGKTTTGVLTDAALRAAGHRTGLIGTLGFTVDGVPLATARSTVTTPEAPDLQALLAVMVEAGIQVVVMEVSSHALVLGRVDPITYDVAAFTNLGRDHLDFHGDEESYFEAKAALFVPERARHAVLNVDDPRGRAIADRVRRGGAIGLSTLSLRPGSADYTARPVPGGLEVHTPREALTVALSLPGEFNLRNALTALAMVDVLGVDLSRAAAGLAGAVVPGRMQRVPLGAGAPAVYVDFAHTPQAVAAVLAALGGQRRLVVLGCGGDRDPVKRRPMGAAAARGADVVIVTDDNPRDEDPSTIRRAVLEGARAARSTDGSAVDIVDGGDRRAAIRKALAMAGPRDVVAVLGKGHETGQEIAGQILSFDDADVVRQEWADLGRSAQQVGR